MIAPTRITFTLLAGFFLVVDALSALAQNWVRSEDETHWLSLQPGYASVGVTAEAYDMEATSGGSSYRETRLFIGPAVDLGVSGSIYHPNLAAYRLSLDGSLGWDQETYHSDGVTSSSRELRFLGSFGSELQLLDNKPVHGRLYANYTHSYQDYDFFNRIYLDTWRYGGVVNYAAGPWKISGQLFRVTEKATDNTTPRSSDTQTAALDVTHARSDGSTSLSASVDHYTRNDSGFNNSGQDYILSLSDAEDFGARKQYHALVSAGYNHLENLSAPTDLYNLMGSLRADHTERLSSQHQVNYSHSSYGSSTYDSLNGSSSLQHRLFDSLTSTLTAQGYSYSSTTGPNRQDSWQLGGGPGFNYMKRLGPGSSLTASESLGLFHTELNSSGGILSADESHSFGTGAGSGYFTLRQGNVIDSSIVLSSGPNGTGTIYNPVTDGYQVVINGRLVLIQRLPGSIIPDSVFVHYDFYASPSGSYDTLNNSTGFRLDFFHNLWSVYARLTVNRNSGAENLYVQDLNDLVVGTEVNWRFLRAGAEYENYDSSLSPYDALRFFQTVTFRPEVYSTASLNFTETYMNYSGAGRSEQNYRAVFRYNRRLAHHLGLTLELGANQRIGENVDETLAVVRPELRYAVGNFSATVGYDFGYDEYLNTLERVSNRAYIRLRKDF